MIFFSLNDMENMMEKKYKRKQQGKCYDIFPTIFLKKVLRKIREKEKGKEEGNFIGLVVFESLSCLQIMLVQQVLGATWCNFEGSRLGSCILGDCGSGTIKCNNVDATLPTTLAEFTLGTNGQDFYDVSLIDGCNLSMIVEGSGWLGMCASTSCTVDLNQGCPAELKVGDGSVCRSACEAFGSPEYSCSNAYNTPAT